jgi:hypothetical protein
MKVYQTKEELLSALDAIAADNSDAGSYRFTDNKQEIKEFVKLLKDKKINELIKKLSTEKDATGYLDYGNRLSFSDSNATNGRYGERCIYKVQNEQLSLFDLFDISDEDINKLYNASKKENILKTKIFYAHFVNRGCMEKAEEVFSNFVKEFKRTCAIYYRDVTVLLSSDLSKEFIPVFRYYEKMGESIKREMLELYIRALYSKNTYLDNTFDRVFHKELYSKYKDIIKSINTSSFFVEDGRIEKRKEAPLVDDFDLIESDPVAKDRVFRVFTYDFAKMLKDLIRKDSKRAFDLMYDYLNTVHYKGKKRKQFISTYGRLKEIIEDEGFKFDHTRLNEYLQAHLVLNILN